MSIKRISRTRVVAPITEYVDEESLATRVGTIEDWRASGPDETRVGGNVETKASPALESSDLQSRVGSNVETRTGTDVESRYITKEGSRAEPAGGKDSPTKSRWSV